MSLDDYLVEAEIVIQTLKKKFSFGYYDEEDIAQEARIYAIESYADYDGERAPQPFIRICLTNDLHNLYRKKCRRSDVPCIECAEGRGCLPGGELCEPFKKWINTQNMRSSLMNTGDISEINEEESISMATAGVAEENASSNELAELIDSKLSPSLRGDYLKLLSGIGISASRKVAIQVAVSAILQEHMPCLMQN